jgi:hypothetical protein
MDLEAEAGAMSAGKAMCDAVIREWNRHVITRWPTAKREHECPQRLAHMILHGSRVSGARAGRAARAARETVGPQAARDNFPNEVTAWCASVWEGCVLGAQSRSSFPSLFSC